MVPHQWVCVRCLLFPLYSWSIPAHAIFMPPHRCPSQSLGTPMPVKLTAGGQWGLWERLRSCAAMMPSNDGDGSSSTDVSTEMLSPGLRTVSSLTPPMEAKLNDLSWNVLYIESFLPCWGYRNKKQISIFVDCCIPSDKQHARSPVDRLMSELMKVWEPPPSCWLRCI